jgi:hypothetical protein
MARKSSSDVGKAVGIGAPAVAGGAIGFALGGPVGAAIGTFLGGLLGAIGVGKVEEKEREAKAQTDPFLEEKREVIRRLMQMSPYLPDMSYSDFARMLGIEEGKRGFSPFILPLTSSPLSGILSGLTSWQLFGNRTSSSFPIFSTTDPIANTIAMSIVGAEKNKGTKRR